jgi:outer membrane protein OmpA-like peptidoglycan-associated protein
MRLWVALPAVFLITACASKPAPRPVPADVVVLLPHADGTTGAVVVRQGNREVQLDSPYASARSGGDGRPTTGRENEAMVRKEFAATLDALPPAPLSFVFYFLSGSDEFTEDSKVNVNLLLEEMGRRASPEITVIGHTDRVGNDQANDELSLQRARRVKDILIKMGVAGERINVAGRGEREPLVPTADGVAESRNRRVEISVR